MQCTLFVRPRTGSLTDVIAVSFGYLVFFGSSLNQLHSANGSTGTLLTNWTNWDTERESGGSRKVCRGKQDLIVQGPCTT